MSDLVPRENEEDEQEDDLGEESADWAGDPKKMGFLDHVEELRWAIIKPLIVLVIGFVLSIVFIKDVKDVLMFPLDDNYSAGDAAVVGFEGGLATRNPTGVFTAMLHIGLIVGVTVASPVAIYYTASFLAPALTKKERRMLAPGAFCMFFLFLLGTSFAFFLLLPKAIMVTKQLNAMMDFVMVWTPDSYFGFVTWIVLGMGVAFQFPLVAVILVYLDVVTVQKLRSMRRVFIVCFFIAAAVLTPPDPVTQLMMAVPMILLYEISIIVARVLVKKRIAKEEAYEREFGD